MNNKLEYQSELLVDLVERLPQVGSFVVEINLFDINYGIQIDLKYYDVKLDYLVKSNGELILGHGHYKISNKEETILMAGEIKINSSGIIYYLNNNSGHYQPDIIKFNSFYNYLKEETKLLTRDVVIEYYVW